MYSCLQRRCAAVKVQLLDDYVESAVVAWLAREDVHAALVAATASDDQQAATARAEVNRLGAELEDWRREAEAGNVTVVSFARAETGLLDRIAAEQVANQAAVPPVLRDLLGPDAARRWDRADLAVKRDAIRAIAPTIRLHPAGKGARRPLPERVELGGPIAG